MAAAFCDPATSAGCGSGVCLNGTSCLCAGGYIHDATQSVFRNCFLTSDALIAVYIILAGSGGLVSLWALVELVKKRMHGKKFDKSRRLLMGVCASQLTVVFYIVAHAIEGRHYWGTSIMLGIMLGSIATVGCWVLRTFLIPLATFAPRQLERVDRWITAFSVASFLGPLAFWMPACALLEQGLEDEFNIVVAVYFSFVVLLIAAIAVILAYIDSIVLRLLKYGDKWDNASRNHAAQFAKQVRLVSRLMSVVFAFVVLVCALLIILQVTLRVYPYRFLLWLFITLAFPLFGAACIVFAKFSVRQEPSSNSNHKSVRISSRLNGGSSVQLAVSAMSGTDGMSSAHEPASVADVA